MTRLTPQQKAMASAQQAHSAYQARLAEQELQARKEPIKAIATSYNVDLGEWEATTPDGGTIRAKSLSNANIKGRPLPVQRFSGSQEAAINEAPTSADFGQVYSDVEQLGQQIISLSKTQLGTDDPNTLLAQPQNNLFLEDDKGALWYWDSSLVTPAWVCFSQLYQGFSGVPSVAVRIDGAIAINDAGTIYTGTVAGGWTELSTGSASVIYSRARVGLTLVHNTANLMEVFNAIIDPQGWFTVGATATNSLPAGTYMITYEMELPVTSAADVFIAGVANFAGATTDRVVASECHAQVSTGTSTGPQTIVGSIITPIVAGDSFSFQWTYRASDSVNRFAFAWVDLVKIA